MPSSPPVQHRQSGLSSADQVAHIQRFQRLLDRCRQLDLRASAEIDRLNAIPAGSPRKAAEAGVARKMVIEQLRVHGQMTQTLNDLRRGSNHPMLPEIEAATKKLAVESAENLIALNQMCGRRPDDASP